MANKLVTLTLNNETESRKAADHQVTVFPIHSYSMNVREVEGMNWTATESGIWFENEARREKCGGEETRKKPALSD